MYLQFSALKEKTALDPNHTMSIITGVQMIQIGPARGHKAFKNSEGEFECYDPLTHSAIPPEALYQVTIDQGFLDSVLALAQASPNGIKALMNHNDDIRDVFGACRNWRQDGDTLRADVHLLKKSQHAPYVAELAAELPEEVGFSINFEFDFIEAPNTGDKQQKNVFCICTKLSSSDLVTEGAATSGLFSSKSQSHKPNTIMAKKLAEGEAPPTDEQQQDDAPDMATVITDAITSAVAPILESVDGLSARMKKLEDGTAPEKKDDELEDGDDKDGDGDKADDKDKDAMSATDKMAAKVAKKVLSSLGLVAGALRPSVSGAVDTSRMTFSQVADHIAKTENKNAIEANKLALQRYPEKHREFRKSLSKARA